MSTRKPDLETIRAAIALATRAPSVHNTQPWRWLIGHYSVHLLADWARQVPATDPDGRDLLISCGATLHHLRIALAALGWAAEVHRIPALADIVHLASVRLRPHEPSEEDIALAAAIPRRHTDRRRYSSWPVPPEHLELMTRRASRAGALLVPVTDPHTQFQLTGAIAEAAARQEHSPAYAAELSNWTGRGRTAEDGVPAASTPERPCTHGDTQMRAFPHGTLTVSAEDEREDDASELLVLATPADDPRSRLRAGEAASMTMLTAADLGLASCPLSQALEVADTRETIRDRVLDGANVPHLILRVGWAHPSDPPLPQAPRRPLAEILQFLPGVVPSVG